jgi:hypothetical protein
MLKFSLTAAFVSNGIDGRTSSRAPAEPGIAWR